MSSDPNASPVNPLPPAVTLLFLLIVGIEAAFSLGAQGMIGGPGAVGWRLSAIQSYGFYDGILEQMWQLNYWPTEHLVRLVSYAFVHGSLTHAAFAGVILLAMGKMVSEAFGQWRMLAIFLASSIGGAVVYAIVLDDPVPLIGSFPGVYGLIGGFTYVLWRNLDQMGQNQYRAFTLIGFLMGIQLVFGLLFGGQNDWVADVSGFGMGFALSFVLSPGGWGRMRTRIRHD
ncbi:rhomboid family intramembrane serine protease [Aestuariivita sp.]|jgi:membrane associated rhomboid family serine protease|uniref:rhomboid family intramembrane serine protease n=1 Tax=Aestuariivita sp. TaxID=1872407 RepID=UPI00216B89DE|nr:rhomboid family intramembrane serine protease [Aestuariivita sp.]MCE8007267.1 rhomboid family intramembrane serine protease [Aestuariivita sp.]